MSINKQNTNKKYTKSKRRSNNMPHTQKRHKSNRNNQQRKSYGIFAREHDNEDLLLSTHYSIESAGDEIIQLVQTDTREFQSNLPLEEATAKAKSIYYVKRTR